MRAAKRASLGAAAASPTSRRSKTAKSSDKTTLPWNTATWRKKSIRRDDITFVLRNVSTLIENGVSLPKAIGALAEERAMESCRDMLQSLRKKLETGATLSGALAQHSDAFDSVTVNQIKVGERAGTLSETLANIASQREKAGKLRGEVIKKLAYPGLLVIVGTGVITFLLAYVVPVFEETYRSAKVPLPGITQTLIIVGHLAQSYWMLPLLLAAIGVFALKQIRKNDRLSQQMDAKLLQLPLAGDWLRDIAVLELMEVIGNLMEAGFNLAEALDEAGESVTNRAVRGCVRDLQQAVHRGERFSREIERHRDLFPPLVSQLVIVGEQTGNLTKATRHIREHLHDEIERKSNVFVGVIEPTLTISLAGAVAVILLAIYLPMFDMINTVG